MNKTPTKMKDVSRAEANEFFSFSKDMAILFNVMRDCRDDIELVISAFKKNQSVISEANELLIELEKLIGILSNTDRFEVNAMKHSGYLIKNPVTKEKYCYTKEQLEEASKKYFKRISKQITELTRKVKNLTAPTKEEFLEYINKTHTDFNTVVPMFRDLQKAEHELVEIISYPLPAQMNMVAPDKLPSYELTDDGYKEQIKLLRMESNPFSKLTILQLMIRTIIEGRNSLISKDKKLTEFCKRTSGCERNTAYEKKRLIKQSIQVLTKRLNNVTALFCEIRSNIADIMMKFSESTFKIFDEGDPVLANNLLKYNVSSNLSDIINLDSKIKTDNFRQNKRRVNIQWLMK